MSDTDATLMDQTQAFLASVNPELAADFAVVRGGDPAPAPADPDLIVSLLASCAKEHAARQHGAHQPDPWRDDALAFRLLLKAALTVRSNSRLFRIVEAEGILAHADPDDHRTMEEAYKRLLDALWDAYDEAITCQSFEAELADEAEEAAERRANSGRW